MVQVDVFWSYGIGAGLALAAGRQLRARRAIADADGGEDRDRLPGDPRDRASLWRNPFFLKTVLYAALLFAPSGIYLLWEFPDWETMQVGSRDMPAWLVAGFAITNVTQAILGFVIVQWLLLRDRAYLAYLQMALAYFGMLFILVHGWDGEGYRRFFSPDRADYLSWDGDWSSWLTSDVAITLYVMGVVLIPVLMTLVVRWTLKGNRLATAAERRPSAVEVLAVHLGTPLVVALGLAIVASVSIHLAGPLGIVVAAVLVTAALFPNGPVFRLFSLLGLQGRNAPEPARASIGQPAT